MSEITLGTWANGKPATLDLPRLLESRMLIQASSGGGKSWALRRLLEVTSGQVQQIIIDPEGEFASLREQHDLVIAAATGGDALAHPKTAALLATRLLETGVSAVLDIYDLKKADREAFVKLFVDALVNAPKSLWHPVMVVIDEAHMFADESERAASTQAVIDLATRGRKRGLCLVAATQRISDFNKSAAAQLKNKLIGNTGLDVDVKRAAFELGKTPKEAMEMLRDLQAGEFYGFGPALSHDVQIVKTGDVKTTHPKVGHRQLLVPPKPTDAIKAILPKLADLPKEAEEEARTVAELQREIATLKRNVRAAPAAAPVDTTAIERRADQVGWSRGYKEGYRAGADWLARRASEAISKLSVPDKIPLPEHSSLQPVTKPALGKPAAPIQRSAPTQNGDLSGPEQRIIDAIAWLESIGVDPCEQPAVAFLANYTYGGGAFNNPRGSLRVKGLVEYVGKDQIRLTDAGRALANTSPAPLTNQELHARILARLPGPEQRLLQPLIEAYPDSMSNEDLAAAARYVAGAGSFNNPRGRLKSLGLIRYVNGQSVAADHLFPLGA